MITRRTLLATALGAGALTVLAACSGSAKGSAAGSSAPNNELTGALARIKKAGVLRVGMEGVYPPFSFHGTDGALDGIEKQIGDLIAKDLSVKAQYVETKWDSLIAGMDVNKYDLVINQVAPTDERKAKYDFSIPYGRVIGKIGVGPNSSIKTLADLKGKRSAQTASSNWGAQAKELGATLVPADGFTQTVELVATGRADATINDLVSFEQYFKEHSDSPVKLLDLELPNSPQVAVLINKGNPELKDELDRIITAHLKDGSIAAITEKFAGADLTPKS